MADNQQVTFDEQGFPDLTQLAEDGFVDMVFRIRDIHVDPNGWHTFTVDAKHEGTVVGFRIAVRSGMRPGFVDGEFDKTAFYPGGILILRHGPGSDALLRAFEMLYGAATGNRPFRDRVTVTAIGLHGDPSRLKSEYIKFKLFHDDQDERGEYFELYLHINVPGGVVALNEKAPEYRPTVLKGLAQNP